MTDTTQSLLPVTPEPVETGALKVTQALLPVKQSDRDAAAEWLWDPESVSWDRRDFDKMKSGSWDDHSLIQAFARHRTASEQPASGEVDRIVTRLRGRADGFRAGAAVAPDNWMTISVDEAAQTIGIDHPTKAAWADVYRAMAAVRDHINDRIANQEGCPVRPKTVVADGYRVATPATQEPHR